jgi:23S rRNA (cytidine1920-2'-O)/16S rRNA (cytidine1409-2'-O)-methyltransferase
MARKVRLDRLLVERGMAPTAEKAAALILSGVVLVRDRVSDKAGLAVPVDVPIRLRGKGAEEHPYVSRGGVKLKGAIETFDVAVQGLVALDVGASTGGFTDCLLQEGAARVYALDVGYGQLAWRLRRDPRVVVLERTNIRTFDPQGVLGEPVDLVTIDASFISLKRILPSVIPLVRQGGAILSLIKPQFEARRDQIGVGGVVSDAAIHQAVLEDMGLFCVAAGLTVLGTCPSPLTGPAGNREFFLYARKGAGPGA